MRIVVGAGVVDGAIGRAQGAAEFAGDHDGRDIEQRAAGVEGRGFEPFEQGGNAADGVGEKLGLILGEIGGMNVELLGQHIDRRARQRQAEALGDERQALLLGIRRRIGAVQLGQALMDLRRAIECRMHERGGGRHAARSPASLAAMRPRTKPMRSSSGCGGADGTEIVATGLRSSRRAKG